MSEKITLNATQIYVYLNKKGICDQVRVLDDGEISFLHWNQVRSQLIEAAVVKNGMIHKLGYSREIIPALFARINTKIINNLDPKIHKFVKIMKYE